MSATNIVLTVALLPVTVTMSVSPDFSLSNREMEIRAEYYTEGGKYLGGDPKYDNEFQLYECTNFNSDNIAAPPDSSATNTDRAEGNATVCVSWTTHEVRSDVYDLGRCSCQSIAKGDYCDAWICSRLRVGSTQCTCGTEDSESGKFCSAWTCVGSDDDGTQEFGEYQCVTASTSSPEHCQAWTGVTEDSTEVVSLACECVEQWGDVGVCSQWECKERSLHKCSHANKWWCNIGVAIGWGCSSGSIGPMLIAFSVYNAKKMEPVLCLGYILCGVYLMWVWVPLVLVWGGHDGAVIAGICWGAIIALGLVCHCRAAYADAITYCLATVRDRTSTCLAAIRDRTTKCLATYRGRTPTRRDEQDEPILSSGTVAMTVRPARLH